MSEVRRGNEECPHFLAPSVNWRTSGRLAEPMRAISMHGSRPGPPSSDAPRMISVVVCTFNRAGPLQRFLARIGELGTPRPDLPWELVVIDNNSNDGTREVVERMRAQL